MTLKELAVVLGEELEVKGAEQPDDTIRWTCVFRGVEVMERSMLVGAYGQGATPLEARRDYARQLSGQRVVQYPTDRASRCETQLPDITA